MRKKLFTVLVTTLIIAVCFIENAFGVPIDEANFPDPGFRSQVRQYDTGWTEYDSDGKAYLVGNGDGVLDWPELSRVTGMNAYRYSSVVIYDTPSDSNLLINSSNFPDDNFRNYISTVFDPDGDGIITDDEIAGITGIEAVGLGIKSMKGIEYFTALEYLTCDGNELTELDLSGNPELRGLSTNNNQLSSLNVSNNPKLYQVWLSFNFLTEADFTQNPELAILDCRHNLLTSLNVSDNPNLISLAFGNFEEWEKDVSKWEGNRIRTIDLSNNLLLENLSCEGNEMESLNISGNTSLKTLYCGWNNISALDISNNPLIMHLDCGGNNLTALNVGHLEEL